MLAGARRVSRVVEIAFLMAVLFATLFIMPAAAFAAEAQTELLDPGTLTLTVDPDFQSRISNTC